MSELAGLLERYRRGAELVAMTMTGAAGAEVDYVAEPGKWSVRQIVCHLADSEMIAAMRLRQILAEDEPALIGFNQDLWAERLDYAKKKPSHAIETFRRIRGENYELLKDLGDEAFGRGGMHPKRGRVTLLDMLTLFTNHAEKHALQIRNVRAAYKEVRAAAQAAAKPASQ